jgi:hypothetical protein
MCTCPKQAWPPAAHAQASPAALLQDDAAEDLDEEDVDWRIFSQRHSLTDKMQKLADQVRRKELKCENLKKESDKIVAKERCVGLHLAWLLGLAVYCAVLPDA